VVQVCVDVFNDSLHDRGCKDAVVVVPVWLFSAEEFDESQHKLASHDLGPYLQGDPLAQIPSKLNHAFSQYGIFAREKASPLTRHTPFIRLDTSDQVTVGYLKDITVGPNRR
jgi:hypothetical protein